MGKRNLRESVQRNSQTKTSVLEETVVRHLHAINDQILEKARDPSLCDLAHLTQHECTSLLNQSAVRIARELLPLILRKEQLLKELSKRRTNGN